MITRDTGASFGVVCGVTPVVVLCVWCRVVRVRRTGTVTSPSAACTTSRTSHSLDARKIDTLSTHMQPRSGRDTAHDSYSSSGKGMVYGRPTPTSVCVCCVYVCIGCRRVRTTAAAAPSPRLTSSPCPTPYSSTRTYGAPAYLSYILYPNTAHPTQCCYPRWDIDSIRCLVSDAPCVVPAPVLSVSRVAAHSAEGQRGGGGRGPQPHRGHQRRIHRTPHSHTGTLPSNLSLKTILEEPHRERNWQEWLCEDARHRWA